MMGEAVPTTEVGVTGTFTDDTTVGRGEDEIFSETVTEGVPKDVTEGVPKEKNKTETPRNV